MPLYEYKCQSCGKTFEVIEKFSDEPLKTHAGCGGAVERLFSAPAFHLKGSGWYATDYAKTNGGKPDASAKTDAATTDSKSSESSESSESKPDSKSESKAESKSSATDSK